LHKRISIQSGDAICRRPEVQARVGLGKSTLYVMVKAGTFPAPIKLGARAVGWLLSDVSAWIERQARQARGEA
jgi:prophage regulatory protein